jgi:hypothetical protein
MLFSGRRIVRHGTETFTASTTWQVPPHITEISIVVVGGGGNGGVGGIGTPPITPAFVYGGGGGGGETVIDTLLTVVPNETLTVTVGAAQQASAIDGSFGTISAAAGNSGFNHDDGSFPSYGGGGGGAQGGAGGTPGAGGNGTSSVVGTLTRYGGGGGGSGNNSDTSPELEDGGDGHSPATGQGGAAYLGHGMGGETSIPAGFAGVAGVVIITW